jgi:integrase
MAWCADRAEYRDYVQADACTARETRDVLPKPRAKDDCLQREMLKPWFEHVRRIPNPAISAFLQIALLTGARRSELLSLTWDAVDFQWQSMTIHDKTQGSRVVPMTPHVGILLAALPRRNEFVFGSAAARSGRLQEPRIQHVRALAAAALPHVTIHGLRRSFGTLSEWVEAPVGVVAQIMGHAPSALAEKHYRRRPLDLLRMWHTRIEAWVLDQAGIEQPTEGAQSLRVVV